MGQFAVRVTKTNDDTRPDYDNDKTTQQNSQVKWHFGRKGTTGRCRCCLLMMPPPCRYRIRCSGCLFGSKAGATGQSRLPPYGRDRRFATNRLVTVQPYLLGLFVRYRLEWLKLSCLTLICVTAAVLLLSRHYRQCAQFHSSVISPTSTNTKPIETRTLTTTTNNHAKSLSPNKQQYNNSHVIHEL